METRKAKETEENEDTSILDVEATMGKLKRDMQEEGIKYPYES
jgi:hypothetical protein